jgi:hypothetical protein
MSAMEAEKEPKTARELKKVPGTLDCFKLVPVSQTKDSNGPLDLEWDLRLTR